MTADRRNLIIGFGLLAILAYASCQLLSEFVGFLQKANSSISAAIIGAMTTVFASIGGILLAQYYSKRREADDAHRQRKVEIYQKYLNIIGRLMVDKNSGSTITEPSHQEIVDFAVEFKTNLILWGSPKVVNAYLNFLRASTAGHSAVLMSADEMYRAIREDLGLSNRGLHSHQLVRMHLKDPDEKFK